MLEYNFKRRRRLFDRFWLLWRAVAILACFGDLRSRFVDAQTQSFSLYDTIIDKNYDLRPIDYPQLSFYNIKGISTALTSPLFYFNEQTSMIAFYNTQFDLYNMSRSLVGANECDAALLEQVDLQYLSTFEGKQLFFMMNEIDFSRPICPYLFKNAQIGTLMMLKYGKSALFNNVFSFYTIRNTRNSSVNLNSKISQLAFFDIFYGHLERGVFVPEVFSAVQAIYIFGKLALIDAEFGKDFERLRFIKMTIENLGQFFHSSNNEWLGDLFVRVPRFDSKERLSSYIKSNFSTGRVGTFIVNQENHDYTYPDEDFCLFKHFARFQMTFSSLSIFGIDPSKLINSNDVSCTYKFLCEKNNLFPSLLDPASESYAYFDDQLLNACDFDQRLSTCFRQEFKPVGKGSRANYQDSYYALEWIEFVGPVITFPIFAALAFVLNLLVILIIRSEKNKKGKLFESKAFRFIEMNSAFNCIECLIYQLRLLGICMGPNSIFCSQVRRIPAVFGLGVVVYYFSETMKSCSMISGLYFSIQRYIETSQTENRFFKAFANVGLKHLSWIALVYGLLVATPELFNIEYEYMFATYDIPSISYLAIELYPEQKTATYFHFAHYILNDVIILSLNIVIDIMLVREIKSSLQKKLINKQNMQDRSLEDQETKSKNPRFENKMRSIERKANSMIIISVIIYIFCRLPELIMTFLIYYYYILYQSTKCTGQILCSLLSDAVEYLYMFAYIFNIVLYYKFNTYFNKGFRNFFGIKQVKK